MKKIFKSIPILSFLIGIILIAIGVVFIFKSDISITDAGIVDATIVDFYFDNKNSCTKYSYEIDGKSFQNSICSYSADSYLNKKVKILYDRKDVTKISSYEHFVGTIIILVLGLLLFLYSLLSISFQKLKNVSILVILGTILYIVFLIMVVKYSLSLNIVDNNRVSDYATVFEIVDIKKTDFNGSTRSSYQAIIRYKVDDKDIKYNLGKVKVIRKDDIYPIIYDKENPYKVFNSRAYNNSIYLITLLFIVGIVLLYIRFHYVNNIKNFFIKYDHSIILNDVNNKKNKTSV